MANEKTGYRLQINGDEYIINDGQVRGREIIELAANEPSSEFVLVQRCANGRLETIGLTEKVQLDEGVNDFLMAKSDRTFRLLINEKDYDWPYPIINGCTVKVLSGLTDNTEVILEQRSEADLAVNDDDEIDLTQSGVETFTVQIRKPKKVEITLNNQAVVLMAGTYTGAEIKSEAIKQSVEIEQDFVLSMALEDGSSQIIGDEDEVNVKGGEKFSAIPDDEASYPLQFIYGEVA